MHVAIVGGGVVGTALAASLAADSETSVTLFERDELGSGTTSASAAVFATQQRRPDRDDDALRRRSWETYGPLVEKGPLSFEQVGHLTVAESEGYAEVLRDAVSPLREFGYDAEWVEPERFPEFDLAADGARGALYTPEEGYFDVDELVEVFADEAREAGAEIRIGDAVRDIRTEGRGASEGTVTAVNADSGVVAVDAVVNAAGPWARAVNEMVGVETPLRHTVGPVVVVVGNDHNVPFTIFESKRYLRPAGRRGAYVGKYLTDYEDAEVVDPDAPTDVLADFLPEARSLCRSIAPALRDADVVDEWVGLRTVTPDGRPVVGESSVPGFYLAVGMSGLGVTLAPAAADVLAAEIRGERLDDELGAPLEPERF